MNRAPITGPERRGPERPGPEYPPEWDDEPEDDGVCYGDDDICLCDCCEDEAAVADGLCDECLDHGAGVCVPPVLTVEPLARYL